MLDWCDIIFHENALHLDPTSNLLGWPDFYQYPFPYLFVKKSLEVGACCWRSKARWVCEGKVLKIMIICFWLALEKFQKIWLYLGKLQHLERQIVRPFTMWSSNSNDRKRIWNYFVYVWTDPTFCSHDVCWWNTRFCCVSALSVNHSISVSLCLLHPFSQCQSCAPPWGKKCWLTFRQ